jgi:hypothetical protein
MKLLTSRNSVILFNLLGSVVAAMMNSCATPSGVAPRLKPTTIAEYTAIRERIGSNPAANMTLWGMSYDHLFSNDCYGDPGSDVALRQRCRRFVRIPGTLDFLFDKVIDPKTSDSDILAVTQILVFWGMDDEEGDALIQSERAADLLVSLERGRAVTAEKTYPDLEIRHYLTIAAKKAIVENSKGTRMGRESMMSPGRAVRRSEPPIPAGDQVWPPAIAADRGGWLG